MGWYSQWKLAFFWGCGNYNRSRRGVTVFFNGWSALWREFPVPLLKWRISQGGQNKNFCNQIWVSGSRSWISWVIQIWFIGVIPFHRNFHGLIKSPQVDPARIHDLQRWLMDPIHRDLFRYEGVALRATDPWHGTESAEDFQDVSAFQPSQPSPATWKSSFSAAKAPGGPGCPVRMLRRSCHGTMTDCTTPFANRMSSRFPNLCSALAIDFGHFSWAVGVSFQQEIQLAAPKLENIQWLLIHYLKTLDMPFWGMPGLTRGPRATRGTMGIFLQQPHHTWHHTHAFSGYEGTASSGCRNFTHR